MELSEVQAIRIAQAVDMMLWVAGRLMHHLKEVEGMSLRTVEYCVFDEADRLFEMGFAAQLKEILSKMNESRQVRTSWPFLSLSASSCPQAWHECVRTVLYDFHGTVVYDLHGNQGHIWYADLTSLARCRQYSSWRWRAWDQCNLVSSAHHSAGTVFENP